MVAVGGSRLSTRKATRCQSATRRSLALSAGTLLSSVFSMGTQFTPSPVISANHGSDGGAPPALRRMLLVKKRW